MDFSPCLCLTRSEKTISRWASNCFMPEFAFPKDGILWRSYDETIALLKEKPRPVFAFVLDESGICWPFLREIFKAMPKNEKMRNVLNGSCIPMLLKADSLPEYMKELG